MTDPEEASSSSSSSSSIDPLSGGRTSAPSRPARDPSSNIMVCRINKLNSFLFALFVVSFICILNIGKSYGQDEASEFMPSNLSAEKSVVSDPSSASIGTSSVHGSSPTNTGSQRSLLMLRHARSSYDAPTDFDRPLSQHGADDANRMGLYLSQHNVLPPDLIIASPSKRTRETLDVVQKYWSLGAPVEYPEELYSFDAVSYWKYLLTLDSKYNRVLLIGHNPSMKELAEQLLAEPKIVRKLPMCSFLEIELINAGPWSETAEGRGHAKMFVTPDSIP